MSGQDIAPDDPHVYHRAQRRRTGPGVHPRRIFLSPGLPGSAHLIGEKPARPQVHFSAEAPMTPRAGCQAVKFQGGGLRAARAEGSPTTLFRRGSPSMNQKMALCPT